MEQYKVRYGGSFDFAIETDDLTLQTATFLVGKPGELPVITISATFEDGVAYIHGDSVDTQVPLGEYNWQVTIVDANNDPYKYPTDEYCQEFGLPEFHILEALDETEVVS